MIVMMSKGIQTIVQLYRYYDKIIKIILFFQVTLYIYYLLINNIN